MDSFRTLVAQAPFFLVVLLVLPGVYLPGPFALGYLGVLSAGALGFFAAERRTGLRVTGFLLTALFLGLAFHGSNTLQSGGKMPVSFGPLRALGVVSIEAPVGVRGNSRFTLKILQAPGHPEWGGLQVQVAGWTGSSPALGSLWQVEGGIIPSFPASDQGAALKLKTCTAAGWEAPWWEIRSRIRNRVFESLDRLGDGPAALSQALLLGYTDDLTPGEKASFRTAGCSHVLALSGMHLSLWAVLLTGLFGGRLSRLWCFVVIQAVLLFYCFLAGPIPSLIRALVMSFLAGIFHLRFQKVSALELLSLSFAVCAVVWPPMAATLSLQLSFLSLAGLFLFSLRWERGLRPWAGTRGAAVLAPSLAAMAATAPLTCVLFQEVRWVGILLSPPLVLLTDWYIYLSLGYTVLASLLPTWPWELVRPGFAFLYQTIFVCTGTGGYFPAFNPWTLGGLAAAGGLCAGALFLYNNRHRSTSMAIGLNYDSPGDLQRFLDSRGYNALKRWGQNFLINPGARKRIIEALDLQAGEPVWEIGPGLGALTHHLVQEGHPLTVFEIDPGYAAFLREEFAAAPAGFRLVEGDVLKTWRNEFSGHPLDGSVPLTTPAVKAVGNLPYNAASAIIADFIDGGYFPQAFVVTVQKEMAERMAAAVGTKNYSSFSVLCQSVFTVKDVMVLRPGSFYPAPEVISWVVKLVPHGRYPGLRHQSFTALVRECFSSRRKTLRNNLPGAASALHLSDEEVVHAFQKEGVDLGRRAETLTVEEFVRVYRSLPLGS